MTVKSLTSSYSHSSVKLEHKEDVQTICSQSLSDGSLAQLPHRKSGFWHVYLQLDLAHEGNSSKTHISYSRVELQEVSFFLCTGVYVFNALNHIINTQRSFSYSLPAI